MVQIVHRIELPVAGIPSANCAGVIHFGFTIDRGAANFEQESPPWKRI
jgi:hypothetical protein